MPDIRTMEREPTPDVNCAHFTRVLVVDDDLDTVQTTAVLLRSLGHEVYEACDGSHAIQIAEAVHPELILLDIDMPRLNGLETARCIRRLQLHHRPMIVAVTGWGEAMDRLAAEQAGIDVHLVKPVEFAVLQKLL
jgi:CheY-like chemotaxis protein